MDTSLNGLVTAVIVTVLALLMAGVVYADMFLHGIPVAAPRDAIAIGTFAALRWFIGRTIRTSHTNDDD